MSWAPAKRAVAAYLKATKTASAHALRCGLELLRLKSAHPELRGGDRAEQNPQRAGFAPEKKGRALSVDRIATWPETVGRELGISDDTAQRWMRLARGFLAIEGVTTPWWELSKGPKEALLKAAQTWAKAKTLRELQEELQHLLDDAPMADVGGGEGGLAPVPTLDPAQQLLALQEAAEANAREFSQALWIADLTSAWGESPLFALRPKDDVRIELMALQRAAELRRLWLEKGDAAMLARRAELIDQAKQVDAEVIRLAQAEAEATKLQKALARKVKRNADKQEGAK